MKPDGSKTCKDQDKADVLNTFFQSVFTEEPDGDLPEPPKYDFKDELNDFDISVEKVQKMLKNLHTGKAPGPDGINPLFLANTAESLAIPITILFRKTLLYGKIPDEWKLANVSPMFKKGKNHNQITIDLLVLRVSCVS